MDALSQDGGEEITLLPKGGVSSRTLLENALKLNRSCQSMLLDRIRIVAQLQTQCDSVVSNPAPSKGDYFAGVGNKKPAKNSDTALAQLLKPSSSFIPLKWSSAEKEVGFVNGPAVLY